MDRQESRYTLGSALLCCSLSEDPALDLANLLARWLIDYSAPQQNIEHSEKPDGRVELVFARGREAESVTDSVSQGWVQIDSTGIRPRKERRCVGCPVGLRSLAGFLAGGAGRPNYTEMVVELCWVRFNSHEAAGSQQLV